MSEIKAGAILNYVRLFISLGIGFFLSPFVLASLGKSEYGIYTIAGTIIGWLALCDFGLATSTTKFLSEYQARGDHEGEAHYLGNVAVLFSIIGGVVLIAGLCIYPFLSHIFPKFNEEELKLYRILYLMTLFNTALMFPARSLGGISASRQKYKIPGMVSTGISLASTTGSITVLLLGYKSIALCAVSIAFGILGMLWNVYYCFGILKARMSWNGWDIPLCKSMFVFSFWMFLDQLIGMLNWGCGNMIMGMTQGASQIAVFSYGLALMQYYFMASNCISGLFLPKVVKMVNSNIDKESLTDLWIKVARIHVFILGLMLSGLILLGRQFLTLWVGHTLGESTVESWWVALILISTITIPLVQCLGWQILQAYNAIHYRVKALFIVAFLNLFFGYMLSIHYGGIGLAIGTACSFICGQWIYMNFLYRYKIGLNVIRFFRETASGLFVPITVIIASYFTIRELPTYFNSTWSGWIVEVITFSLIYILLMINFYLKKTEIDELPQFVRRVFFINKL